MLYPIILGIHGYGMCIALLMRVASELALVIARRGLAPPARVAFHLNRCAGILTAAGMLAGVALFFTGGWPLTAWLVASLALIAVLIMMERRFVGPWLARGSSTLKGAASREDVRALACDSRALLGRLAMTCLFGLVILLMAMKPQVNF